MGESQTKSYLQEKPLKDTLISRLRPIIREPGEAPQYSNYGMSVAGYVVESMTCTPFNKYMEDNILKPLHMNNSSFSFNNKLLGIISFPPFVIVNSNIKNYFQFPFTIS
ncbi:beta-lactamase family protein [Clostridium estertheticum]|nr:beta-lactamase family protein [Clostridium estertheticum]MCB2347441.1 beta-lactamase family protein [Clostridium estertheticum]MCB2351734.1 beta-lactamase family protein [Clostridium estertheticum]WAG47878.1 beta-lactamase family protein [Clostridium estertheticum]